MQSLEWNHHAGRTWFIASRLDTPRPKGYDTLRTVNCHSLLHPLSHSIDFRRWHARWNAGEPGHTLSVFYRLAKYMNKKGNCEPLSDSQIYFRCVNIYFCRSIWYIFCCTVCTFLQTNASLPLSTTLRSKFVYFSYHIPLFPSLYLSLLSSRNDLKIIGLQPYVYHHTEHDNSELSLEKKSQIFMPKPYDCLQTFMSRLCTRVLHLSELRECTSLNLYTVLYKCWMHILWRKYFFLTWSFFTFLYCKLKLLYKCNVFGSWLHAFWLSKNIENNQKTKTISLNYVCTIEADCMPFMTFYCFL